MEAEYTGFIEGVGQIGVNPDLQAFGVEDLVLRNGFRFAERPDRAVAGASSAVQDHAGGDAKHLPPLRDELAEPRRENSCCSQCLVVIH